MPTISIVLANLALIVIFGILIWLGMMAASENPQHRYALVDLISVYAASLLPIALAYHVAHYLPSLLVEMQYVALAIDGMFGRNIHILGLDAFMLQTAFSSIWTGADDLVNASRHRGGGACDIGFDSPS